MVGKQTTLKAVNLFLIALLFAVTTAQAEPKKERKATVYYNEACTMCSMYLKMELLPLLKKNGVSDITMKDFVNEKQNRVELNNLNKKWNIPPTLQGHFMIFIDNDLVLGGHVPSHIVNDLLTEKSSFDRLLVLQDDMSNAKSYFAWGFKGEAKEYAIETPISEYLEWFQQNRENLKAPEKSYEESWSVTKMLPLILSTGFLDGINPCAFAVLLFFIAFLYTIQRTKTHILQMGIAYIFSIFLAYFLIGIGLVKAFIFTGHPHLMAVISAWIMIVLGGINIGNILIPGMNINLGIPSFSKDYLKQWMYKATIPTTFVLGFLVGLCTFPCSGGMYVAVVGLLATKTSFTQGMIYLILYNIMFVMPLVLILAVASNKRATDRITKWEQSKSKLMKLSSGIIMILLGLAFLLWFI